jgi:LmeA-like phospholipid-binding
VAPPRRPGTLWLWSVAVLAAAIGANLGTPVIAAAAVRGSLRTLLGTAQVDVALQTWPPPALWWGSVDRMTVRARDVQTGDLRLDQFDATFQGVRLDPRALYAERILVIRSVESGRARGTMSQEALARAIAQQRGVRVEMLALRSGRVLVRGTIRVLGADVAVDGSARLALHGHDSIDLILDRTRVAGVGSVAAIRGQLTTRVSPALRVPALPLGLRLTNVRVEDGRLLLDAATGPS